MVSVTMPRLGESVAEGTVTRWLKSEGDRVEADEPLLEVSTDKVDTEVPSPAAGVLSSIKVSEDETVDVGEEIATIEEGGEAGGGGQAEAQAPAAAEQEEQPAAEQEAPQQPAAGQGEQPAAGQEEQQPAAEQEEQQPAAEQEAPQQPSAEQDEQPAGDQAPRQERPTSAASPAATQARPAPTPEPAQRSQPAEEGGDDQAGPYVTPLVRRLAAEQSVDLSTITGTGVGGRIRKQDVLQAAGSAEGRAAPSPQPSEPSPPKSAPSQPSSQPEQQPEPQRRAASQPAAGRPAQPAEPAPAPGRTEKMSRLRKIIAERMTESLQVSAQLTTVVEADVTRIARLRERARDDFERREGVKLSFLPFFAAAACEALKEHPAMNASLDMAEQTVTYHDGVHLGIAVDTDRGLLVPVIHGAGDLNLAGLTRKIADLAERSRTNRVSPDELSGGTFTITNIGSRGALLDTPIINQPQVGILGTGAVVKRPVVVDDPDLGEVIAVRSMAYLVLTYDHRLVDGADAARFVGGIKERLEDGAFEGDLGLA